MKNKTTIVLSEQVSEDLKLLAAAERLSASEYIETLLLDKKQNLKAGLLRHQDTKAASQVITIWHQQPGENRTETKGRVLMEYVYFTLFDLCEIDKDKLREVLKYVKCKLPSSNELPEIEPYLAKCDEESLTVNDLIEIYYLISRDDNWSKGYGSYFTPRVWEVVLRDCAVWRSPTAVKDNYSRLAMYIDRIF